MSRLTKQVAIILSILILVFTAVGFVMAKAYSPDDKTYRSLTVYSEVLEHVQRDYVEDPDIHQVTSGALHGLLDSLDPDSSYLSPLEYTDYKERIQSKATGTSGLALSKRNGYIIVISVLVAALIGGELYARHVADTKVAEAVACEVKDQATASFGVAPLMLWQLCDRFPTQRFSTAGETHGVLSRTSVEAVRSSTGER